MADSTLAAIRKKVRRLTRSPSISQISEADVDEYINTFIQYDFPEHIRLNFLRRTFSFYTEPNIDTYTTTSVDADEALFEFKDSIISVHDPFYIAGQRVRFTQDRDEFFSWWPRINNLVQVATGDGATTNFTGTLADIPVLRDNVIFNSVDINGDTATIIDDPSLGVNNLITEYPGASAGDAAGTINYVTGVFDITFVNAPANGEAINAQTVPYSTGRSISVLYFNSIFTVRPVPDESYKVEMEAYVRPTELLAAGTSPELEQWWQYISYGAAKKIFEDRTDLESIQRTAPEFYKQERLVLRRTLVQQDNERSATIYSQQTSLNAGPWGWWNQQS